jgi:VWFA-related protein
MTLRHILSLAALVCSFAAGSAQQKAAPPARTLEVDVTVAAKSGQPVTGLTQQDFTVLDNKSPRPITSFQPVSAAQAQVEFILIIDAVNMPFTTSAYVRGELNKFLNSNDGHLSHPTTIAVLTDSGTKIQAGFTTDGRLLKQSLDKFNIGLREINRSSGLYGAEERTQISLKAIHQLAGYASTLPGRKIVVWISPGWPLLSGVQVQLDQKQQQSIFGDVVDLSTRLRQTRMTLYDLNPLGANETIAETYRYQQFLRGVAKPSQTDIADLSLQVLSVQSGGLALEGSSDVASQLRRCFDDGGAWYQLTFATAPAEQPNEYHHIDIKVDKPNVTARTRDGYYAQP